MAAPTIREGPSGFPWYEKTGFIEERKWNFGVNVRRTEHFSCRTRNLWFTVVQQSAHHRSLPRWVSEHDPRIPVPFLTRKCVVIGSAENGMQVGRFFDFVMFHQRCVVAHFILAYASHQCWVNIANCHVVH